MVELEMGSNPIMITPYKNPKVYNDEIEKMIREILDMEFIQPSSSLFASSMVLVKKKDGIISM